MRRRRLVLLLLPALLACAACSRGPGSGGGGATPVRRNQNIIYADEIGTVRVSDAYEAILTLRPRFIAAWGTSNMQGGRGVRIVVDGVTERDVDALRNVRAPDIVYIRYLTAMEATTYWGGGFSTPVVYVLTRAGPGAGAVRH
ncbi:MAG TPA: hypothetical protein VF832_02820 [Longimicrobiales bacterium]